MLLGCTADDLDKNAETKQYIIVLQEEVDGLILYSEIGVEVSSDHEKKEIEDFLSKKQNLVSLKDRAKLYAKDGHENN